MSQTMINLARDAVRHLTDQANRQTRRVATMVEALNVEQMQLDKLNQELAEVNTFLAENDPARADSGVTHAENI